MINGLFVLLLLALVVFSSDEKLRQKMRRWWAKGCKACLIQLDLDSTASSKSWAQVATEHTCWLGRRRERRWRSFGRYSRRS